MIKTKNIYYAAYLFTEQLNYSGSELIEDVNNRTGVIFSFKADNKDEETTLRTDYDNSDASVNIREYIDNLVLVRDLMYKTIEKSKRKNLKEPMGGKKNESKRSRKIKIKG